MDKKIAFFSALYLMTGLAFASFYAVFYHWPIQGFFSPGFYLVIISWPIQSIHFIQDLFVYGFAGKTI